MENNSFLSLITSTRLIRSGKPKPGSSTTSSKIYQTTTWQNKFSNTQKRRKWPLQWSSKRWKTNSESIKSGRFMNTSLSILLAWIEFFMRWNTLKDSISWKLLWGRNRLFVEFSKNTTDIESNWRRIMGWCRLLWRKLSRKINRRGVRCQVL